MIPVTKPYFPSREKFDKYIDGIYERQWLTNNGLLVQELTQRLESYLGVENLLLVANGTLALQIAYKTLNVSDSALGASTEAITTPFTFIATASSLKWDGLQPVFVDIDPNTWCLNPVNIEAAISANTRAIVPVHVFGNPCDVEALDAIAQNYKLKIIYDASHAFGVKYKGKSLLNHGDAATLSFHATKLFHTAEGGAIVFRHKADLARAKDMINFGINATGDIEYLGVNAKMNELQAAMGLCVLDEMKENLEARAAVWGHYEGILSKYFQLQAKPKEVDYNYAYFPVVFEDEDQTLRVLKKLKEQGVLAKRYFYPSLETLDVLGTSTAQNVSHDLAKRILCLPIYAELKTEQVNTICQIALDSIR